MIAIEYIKEWGEHVLWSTTEMVEHDLLITKVLIRLFDHPLIREKLIFRGGTAIHMLYLNPAGRYSEDLDFVQRYAEPIGELLSAIRSVLDNWIGKPKRMFTKYGAKLIYRYLSANNKPMKLKIEINTVEHFVGLDLCYKELQLNSPWFTGSANITSFQLDELMATKLRALFQRKKGRDLFDVWHRTFNLEVHNLSYCR